ncbi:hypothetical protein ACFYO8_10690 [Micromonospora sp. NPDC005257]|uniref:hypothetical protein n=1 Tax=Micromonospora sp. NPDC005257 TaxID=3364230 RepID=UPI0036CEBEAA
MAVPTGVSVALAELAIIAGVAVILVGAGSLATNAHLIAALLGVLFVINQVAWPVFFGRARRAGAGR